MSEQEQSKWVGEPVYFPAGNYLRDSGNTFTAGRVAIVGDAAPLQLRFTHCTSEQPTATKARGDTRK